MSHEDDRSAVNPYSHDLGAFFSMRAYPGQREFVGFWGWGAPLAEVADALAEPEAWGGQAAREAARSAHRSRLRRLKEAA